MSQITKIFLLLVVFAIPVLIFLFLKFYGENKFDVPVYHAEGVKAEFAECQFPTDTFKVPMTDTHLERANVTIFFQESDGFTSNDLVNASSRLRAVFPEDISFSAHGFAKVSGVDIILSDTSHFYKLMHCKFVTDTINQFILHDYDGLIRGYYGYELEEVDRLIVEIKILLENG